jgi:ABC-type branched-subunit amino acid transport system permease subunit
MITISDASSPPGRWTARARHHHSSCGGGVTPHFLTRSLNLLPPASAPAPGADLSVALFGKYLCYAMLALSLDLIWGYCGILSLGHGAFFALGGYAMGMYLMRQIGSRGVYGNPILPDFMVFLNYKELPWYWYGFDHFWFAAADGAGGAGPAGFRLRLVRLPLAASPASICRSSPRR